MNKLLFILGQTATGKTGLGLELAKQFGGELIVADSRQVYVGMDIGTGKDVPQGFKIHTSELTSRGMPLRHYGDGTTNMWLVDQVTPNQEWSVAHFADAAWIIIESLWEKGRLPIIVGGTGFYLQSLLNPAPTLELQPDPELRNELDELPLKKLQERLKRSGVARWRSMNTSDRQNPRRLIRAIEIAESGQQPQITTRSRPDSLLIGLQENTDLLEGQIKQRVIKRFNDGMVKEVHALITKFGVLSNAFSATGYQETLDYINKKISYDELIALWTQHELQYAKRQMIWFKKQPLIQWFSLSNPQSKTDIDKVVKNWYDTR